MTVGIIAQGYCGEHDFEVGFREMKADGYDCCDYQEFFNENSFLYSLSEGERAVYLGKIKKAAKEAGISFSQTHAVWTMDAGKPIERVLELTKAGIRGAGALGCNNIAVHPFSPFGWAAEVDARKTFDANVKIFSDLSAYGEEYGVCVCVENLPFPNVAISRLQTVIELVRAVDSLHCKVCLDTGHANILRDDVAQDVQLSGADLRILHVHDNSGLSDSHKFPWQGNIDWEAFGKALAEIGFGGCVSLETCVNRNTPLAVRADMRRALCRSAKIIAGEK